MPKVTSKDGKIRHFPYSKKGVAQAKMYAKASGGKMEMDMKSAMKRKIGKKKWKKKDYTQTSIVEKNLEFLGQNLNQQSQKIVGKEWKKDLKKRNDSFWTHT